MGPFFPVKEFLSQIIYEINHILFEIMFCIHKSKASLQSNRQTNWFSKETTYKNTRCVAGYFLFDIIYYTVYILLQEPIV